MERKKKGKIDVSLSLFPFLHDEIHAFIYLSMYVRDSLWLNPQDASIWDRNLPPNFTLDLVS